MRKETDWAIIIGQKTLEIFIFLVHFNRYMLVLRILFYQVSLKITEYFSSIFLYHLIQRDKAPRVLPDACNFSELQASLTKDGQFQSLVWQDCAWSHLVLVNKGGLYENMYGTV